MLASYCAHLLLNELNLKCVVMIVLMLILPILGLLFWLENKLLSYNSSTEANRCDSKWKEKQDEENSSNIAQCACSFCGRLSNIATRCSRCKTAIYCSNACHVKHWRICHEYECVEIEGSQDHEESPFHGTYFLLTEAEKDNYSLSEVEQRRYEGDVYYIEGGENNVVVSDNGCAVCGNPSSKVCSRCKAIKYCSQTCQHFDWRSGHKFQCLVEKANSTEAEIVNQGRLADGNVVNLSNSNEVEDIHQKNEVEDNANSSSPLRLEFYSEGNTSSIAQIRSSFAQEATNNGNKKEVEDQLRSLEEELAKIRDENMSLRSERNEWEVRARNSIDRLYSFRKENEHQLFMMKHENELMSSSEKQARLMVNNLSQRLHCLQITVETGVEERKKQEEYIHMLQNECARVKVELQEQNKCLKRLTLEVDKTTQFPRRIAEDSRQKIVNALSEIEAVESNANCNEVSQPITLSRTPTFTRQGCSICLSNEKNMAFGCGHMTCLECGSKIRKCHICRRKITSRIRLFPD